MKVKNIIALIAKHQRVWGKRFLQGAAVMGLLFLFNNCGESFKVKSDGLSSSAQSSTGTEPFIPPLTPTPTPGASATPAPTTTPLACGAAPTGSFIGCYYNNQDFTNLVLVRNDSAVNFNWGSGSPATSIDADSFSIVWKGKFNFTSGRYTFRANSDDGIRVYVNNVLVINEWRVQGATTEFQGSVRLGTGTYEIRVEYYDEGYDASAKVSWGPNVASSPTPTPTPTPTSTNPPPQTGGIKWLPGHYVRSDEQGWVDRQPKRFEVYDTVRNVPTIKGASFHINWGVVENERGVYDFSSVDAEINYLAAMGKRSILDVGFLGFDGSTPSVPQKNPAYLNLPEDMPVRRYLGDYMITMGCAGNVTYGGWGARLDKVECMDRYIAFIQEVARRYDGNENVVMIKTGETSTAMNGMNYSNYAQQWYRLPAVMKAAFTKTPAMINNNFLVGPSESKELTRIMVLNGIGMSGPDIIGAFRLPQNPDIDNYGAQSIRGAGVVKVDGVDFDFGNVDNRGTVPSSWEAQVVRPLELTPAYVNEYANTILKSNYTIWTAYLGYSPNQYGGNTPVPAMRWDGTGNNLDYLKNPANAVTNTACPTYYNNRCRPPN